MSDQTQKRTHTMDADSEASSSRRPRFGPKHLTFLRRDGSSQPTYTWKTKDDVVALRTLASQDPETHESIFLASRTLLCRDSSVFSDIISLLQEAEDVYEGHPLTIVQDRLQDLQYFLEVIHDWR